MADLPPLLCGPCCFSEAEFSPRAARPLGWLVANHSCGPGRPGKVANTMETKPNGVG